MRRRDDGGPRAVFFDLGKVLLDFSHEEIVDRLLSKADGREGKAAALYGFLFDREDGLCNLYDEGKVSSRAFYDGIDARFDIGTDYDGFRGLWNGIFRENTGVSRIMAEVRKTRPVYLLSNINELHWEHVRESYPFFSAMDGYVLSYKVKAKKPSRAIYDAALKEAGVEAPEAAFVDDMEENVLAARAAGIKAIRYTGDLPSLVAGLAGLGIKIA